MRLSRRLLIVCIGAFLGSAGADLPGTSLRSADAQRASVRTAPAAIPTELAGPRAKTSPQLAATGNHLEFRNAKVPDRNGAGIRMESTRLTVRNAVFRSNETGILTYYNPAAVLEVHDSQFIDNGFGASQGQAHAIYVGEIARFLIQGSYLTGTQVGHLIKSRAHQTHVRYNRITGESSTASYEVDLPNGGMAYLIGNLIEQGPASQNRAVIAFGEEGLFASRPSQLYMSYNTLVNRLAGWCTWVHAPTGAWVKVVNSIMLGNCIFNVASRRHFVNNPSARATDFADPAAYDFRQRSTSALSGTAVAAGMAGAFPLESAREYRHIATSVALEAAPSSPGAFQSMR